MQLASLTTPQLAAIKVWVVANNASRFDQSSVTLLNAIAAPDYFVWRDLDVETVLDLITFASMTPLDAVPTTPSLTVDVFRARSLACQGKQFNLQNLLIGRTIIRMKRSGTRAAFQDCLTNIPAGSGGALITANWVGVRDAAKGKSLLGEKVLATGAGSFAAPSDLGANAEGLVDVAIVIASESA